jgi:dihydrofolate reductase
MEMGKLVESTFVTLYGVIGEPQVWGPPYWDDEHNAYASKLLGASEALLLGRETYEGFAQAWSARSGDPYADTINAMPKHVASRTLTEATWMRRSSTATSPPRSARSRTGRRATS